MLLPTNCFSDDEELFVRSSADSASANETPLDSRISRPTNIEGLTHGYPLSLLQRQRRSVRGGR